MTQRAILFVTLFFGLLTAISSFFLLQQSKQTLLQEAQAAQNIVEILAESMDYAPSTDTLDALLERDFRHLTISKDRPKPYISLSSGHWLDRWIIPSDTELLIHKIHLDNGQTLYLRADISLETEEARHALIQALTLFLAVWAITLIVLYGTAHQAQRVLKELRDGFKQITQGRLATRLEEHQLTQARELAGQFNQMATALQLAESENTRLSQVLLSCQEHERAQLAQILREDFGRSVDCIQDQSQHLLAPPRDEQKILAIAAVLEKETHHLQKGFQALLQNLHPMLADHLELDSAVRHLAQQLQSTQGITCYLQLGAQLPMLPEEEKMHIYRLLQEALSNIARHAQASCIHLRLHATRKRLRLLLRDNGAGLPPAGLGIGIRAMIQRAKCLGGELRLLQRPGAGGAVYLSIPLKC